MAYLKEVDSGIALSESSNHCRCPLTGSSNVVANRPAYHLGQAGLRVRPQGRQRLVLTAFRFGAYPRFVTRFCHFHPLSIADPTR